MIEIYSIEAPKSSPKASTSKAKNPTKSKNRPRKTKKVKAFLAEHFNKAKNHVYQIKLPQAKKVTKHLEKAHNKAKQTVVQAKKTLNSLGLPGKNNKSEKHYSASNENTKTEQNSSTNKKAPSKKAEKIWNFLQLISTTAVIFSIAFVVTNWSAYQVIFEKRISDFFGLTDNSQLVKIAADREYSQDLPLVASDIAESKNHIPDINLEVAPPDTRVIIPRINKNVPVVPVSSRNLIRRDWGALEKDIQDALRGGVVHYPGTALPGEDGNVVITGHSSYFPWDPGRFKDVFALLHDLKLNDRIVIFDNQQKYTYEVTNIKVVLPEQVEVLNQTGEEKLTLLTCTPIGTNLKRLIIEAKPV